MSAIINAIFSLIFQLLESLFKGLGDGLVTVVPSRRNEIYNADFLNPNTVLNADNKGFWYGDKGISIDLSLMSSLTVGNSGSGKSSTVLINSIIQMNTSSLLVHDPSFELYLKTSGAKAKQGYVIKILNYGNPCLGEKYNPLKRVGKSKTEIKQISKLLVETTLGASKGDVFWNESAINLIAFFITYLIFYTDESNHTLAEVYTLLNLFAGEPKKIDELIVKTNDLMLQEYKGIVAMDQKLIMNVVSTAKTAISMWADETVAELTKEDTVDFESFRHQKTILYIKSDINQMKYYRPLTSIFFEQFFAFTMREIPPQSSLKIFHLIDEASSLYLPMLSIAISNVRKYASGIHTIYQTQNQIIDLYGVQQARNIISNSYVKCFLPGIELNTARELEIMCGKYEFTDDEGHTKIRPLLTADEIRLLDESLIFIGNKPAIKMKLVPYYKQKKLLALSSLSPISLEVLYTPQNSIEDEE